VFRQRSRDVGAHLGLTPKKYASVRLIGMAASPSADTRRCARSSTNRLSRFSLLTRSKNILPSRFGRSALRSRGLRRAARSRRQTCRASAPYLWTGRALQGNSNGMVILVRVNLFGLTWELVLRAIMVVRTRLIFLFGRPLWAIAATRSQVRCGDRCAIRFKSPRRPWVGFSTAFERVTCYETDCGPKSRANERPW
jgi:hypothetical protein